MKSSVELAERDLGRAKADAAAHPNGKGYWSSGAVKRRIGEAETRVRVERLGAALRACPNALAVFLAGLRECNAQLKAEIGYRPYGDEVVKALWPFAFTELHSVEDECARQLATDGVASAPSETRRSNVIPFPVRRKQRGT